MTDGSGKIYIPALIGSFVILIGTVGYSLIEGWDVLDALYMTIITVATIGYGEVKPLSNTGRWFTLFIIVFGVGTMAYLIGQFTRVMVEGSLRMVLGRRKLEAQISKLREHYILCGYGRIGRMIAVEIKKMKLPVVVIENDPDVFDQLEKDGLLYIRGDASDEDNLQAAGIGNAAGLISVVFSDADNLYIVLTARSLNQDLFILSRANESRSIKKLEGAGADRVVSPYLIGARKMAQTILRPAVADFLETTVHGTADMGLVMEEIMVTPDSKIKDVTLLESNIRRDLDLIVIAIKKSDNKMVFNPSAQARINIGDTLIAVGLRENMGRLIKSLGADKYQVRPYAKKKPAG